jgi:2-oxoglutarate ferredoxin oxidoreductase subunit alpha
VKPFGLGNKEALRCKNMWTLGLALWMFDRERQPIVDWLKAKFAKAPELAEANIAALNAGHAYGETVEMGAPFKQHHIAPAPAEPGLYRTVTGAEALALGLVAGCRLAGVNMFFGSYPITPASPLLHHLARLKELGITTFQAEDSRPNSPPRSAAWPASWDARPAPSPPPCPRCAKQVSSTTRGSRSCRICSGTPPTPGGRPRRR